MTFGYHKDILNQGQGAEKQSRKNLVFCQTGCSTSTPQPLDIIKTKSTKFSSYFLKYDGHGQPLTVISVDVLKAKAVNGQIWFRTNGEDDFNNH